MNARHLLAIGLTILATSNCLAAEAAATSAQNREFQQLIFGRTVRSGLVHACFCAPSNGKDNGVCAPGGMHLLFSQFADDHVSPEYWLDLRLRAAAKPGPDLDTECDDMEVKDGPYFVSCSADGDNKEKRNFNFVRLLPLDARTLRVVLPPNLSLTGWTMAPTIVLPPWDLIRTRPTDCEDLAPDERSRLLMKKGQ